MKKCSIFIYYFIIYVFLEILFKAFSSGSFFSFNLINIITYVVFVSVVLGFITCLMKEKIAKCFFYLITFITSFWFSFQFCLNKVYQVYFSFELTSTASQVLEFKKEIFSTIFSNLHFIILFFIPFIVVMIFRKKLYFKRFNCKYLFVTFLLILVSYGLFSLSLLINKNSSYSAYKMYYHYNETELAVSKLGLTSTLHLDIIKSVFDFEEKINLNITYPLGDLSDEEKTDEEKPIVYEYNNLNIDFDSITGNSKIDNMNEYFEFQEGTLKNEYSGYFENKNLIYIMAESFSGVVIDKDRTPTLYKLANNGFVFDNFYSPTINSTIGGEMQMLIGLYPASGVLTPYKSGNTEYAYGLADSFKSLGYNTYAYHNNTYTFQNRYKYLEDMGFDNFKACNNGMEDLIDCKWLASDVDMMNATYNEYSSSDEPFMVFYATVSGHGDYYLTGEFSKKYSEFVQGEYSDGIKSYLAAQIELDRALETLINNLENDGILEDTVIVLAGDHYPYLLDIDEINEASSYERDPIIEVDHTNLIIWNSEMESVKVSKVGSQIDILPTIYNLFGVEYDSRLIIGKDILSTEPGLAMFKDRSWVSDYGKYYSASDTFEINPGVVLPDNYVSQMNDIVNAKIYMSGAIITENYYSYLK